LFLIIEAIEMKHKGPRIYFMKDKYNIIDITQPFLFSYYTYCVYIGNTVFKTYELTDEECIKRDRIEAKCTNAPEHLFSSIILIMLIFLSFAKLLQYVRAQ